MFQCNFLTVSLPRSSLLYSSLLSPFLYPSSLSLCWVYVSVRWEGCWGKHWSYSYPYCIVSRTPNFTSEVYFPLLYLTLTPPYNLPSIHTSLPSTPFIILHLSSALRLLFFCVCGYSFLISVLCLLFFPCVVILSLLLSSLLTIMLTSLYHNYHHHHH